MYVYSYCILGAALTVLRLYRSKLHGEYGIPAVVGIENATELIKDVLASSIREVFYTKFTAK